MITITTLALCLLQIVATTGSCVPPEPGYIYQNQWIPLELDTGRVAVLRRAGAEPATPITGLDVARLAPAYAPGWVQVEFAAPSTAEAIAVLAEAPRDRSIVFISPVLLDERGMDTVVTPQVFVRFREGVSDAAAVACIRRVAAGFEIDGTDYAGLPRLYHLRCTTTSGFAVLAATSALAALPDVEFAEPDFIRRATLHQVYPNDEHFSRFYYLHSTGQNIIAGWNNVTPLPPSFNPLPDFDVDAPAAWDLTQGDPSVITVVFDFGVQADHPDLHTDVSLGRDFTGVRPEVGGGPAFECSNHGTPVAGIVGGRINNLIGGGGVAPRCRVGSARVFNPTVQNRPCTLSANVTAAAIIQGLDWCHIVVGARVTNHSYAFSPPSAALDAKFVQTHDAGMVHFAAAGNSGAQSILYPAAAPAVNSVASLDPLSGLKSDFSSYGAGLDFSAPGFAIFTTDRTGLDGEAPTVWGDPAHPDYVAMVGTSFASPIAAGVAALVVAARPSLTADEVEQIMRETCRDIVPPGYDTLHGHGFPNAYRAVRRAIWPCIGDWNNDGTPNSMDISAFLTDWLTSHSAGTVVGDVDQNQTVNSLDISVFLTAWLSAVSDGC